MIRSPCQSHRTDRRIGHPSGNILIRFESYPNSLVVSTPKVRSDPLIRSIQLELYHDSVVVSTPKMFLPDESVTPLRGHRIGATIEFILTDSRAIVNHFLWLTNNVKCDSKTEWGDSAMDTIRSPTPSHTLPEHFLTSITIYTDSGAIVNRKDSKKE